MIDPSLQLQAALVSALKADDDVAAIVADRVYDRAPGGDANKPGNELFPYVTLGDAQVLPNKWDCVDGTEVHLQIDAWSRAVGFPEVKRLAAAIALALDEQPPDLAGFNVLELQFEQIQYLRDPDGLTRHAALSFFALIDAIA